MEKRQRTKFFRGVGGYETRTGKRRASCGMHVCKTDLCGDARHDRGGSFGGHERPGSPIPERAMLAAAVAVVSLVLLDRSPGIPPSTCLGWFPAAQACRLVR